MLRQYRFLQCVGAFQHQCVIVGRVDFAVGDGQVFATVDVNAVAVGVNSNIVHRTQVAARQDDGKVTTLINRHIPDKDVAAKLQRDGLVARADIAALQIAGAFRVHSGQSFTINHSTPGNGHVFLTDGIDEAVLEIGMTAVLIGRSFPLLRLIVGFHLSRSSENLGPGGEVQFHMTLQADAATEVGTGRQYHPTATLRHTAVDGGIDSLVVERLTIAHRPEVLHIVILGRHGEQQSQHRR